MRLYDVEQRSMEWLRLRLGRPTASNFARIITPKTRRPSASSGDYLHQCLAEWLSGEPQDDGERSQFMQRGSELEERAVAHYEWETGASTTQAGFVTLDDGSAGCSPDRLVGDDGGLEIKIPGLKGHVANTLGELDDYALQCQACMWVCERRWWDILSFNPAFPSRIARIERDEQWIEQIAAAVGGFCGQLQAAKSRLMELGFRPSEPRDPEAYCRAKRDDGRWCMSRVGVRQVDGEYLCAAHQPVEAPAAEAIRAEPSEPPPSADPGERSSTRKELLATVERLRKTLKPTRAQTLCRLFDIDNLGPSVVAKLSYEDLRELVQTMRDKETFRMAGA